MKELPKDNSKWMKCINEAGEIYHITSDKIRLKYYLYKEEDGGYQKVKESRNPDDFSEEIFSGKSKEKTSLQTKSVKEDTDEYLEVKKKKEKKPAKTSEEKSNEKSDKKSDGKSDKKLDKKLDKGSGKTSEEKSVKSKGKDGKCSEGKNKVQKLSNEKASNTANKKETKKATKK